jgi:allophanate hydrolase
VGDWFAYVRGRSEAIAGESLERLVQGADSLRRMQRLVDCEVSLGRAGAQGWKITRSSLPYKVGALLAICPEAESRLALRDLDETGRVTQRVWEIVEEEADGSIFFEANPAKISGATPW